MKRIDQNRPPKRKTKVTVEQIDTTQLPVVTCSSDLDLTLPYYELITATCIYRGQSLTAVTWGWYVDIASGKYKLSTYEILTISSIVIVDGEEISFSIN